MILLLKLITSLVLALIANLLITLATDAAEAPFNSLIVAIVFVSCFSMALISPALGKIKRQGDVDDKFSNSAATAARESGTVKWFNVSKGYGFVTRHTGEDIFVHFRSIRGKGRRSLREGQSIEFIVAIGDKGPQAEDVELLDESS